MKIALITPAAARSRSGNRNTAQRWAAFLRQLGHRVAIAVSWDETPADLMLALHARRSYDSIARFVARYPEHGLIVALTGTDLYRDIRNDTNAQVSLRLATRLIVLQELGLDELAPEIRAKTRVVYQSAQPLARKPPLKTCFEVVVIGHLRAEKDPSRCALALRYVPSSSRIKVVHLGAALGEEMARMARSTMAEEPRYHWLGELPHWRVRRYLARARIMVISSRMEGGANVVSEALAAGTPVIASHMPGNVGLLGKDYLGYFPVEDEQTLAQQLVRAATDRDFYRALQAQCRERKKLISQSAEKRALRALLREVMSTEPILKNASAAPSPT
jgi:putative glycosyltransferase (TIGR04348 family)